VNCSASRGIVVTVYGKHTLTRESQEVMVGLMALIAVLDDDMPSRSTILCTAIPLCGQLNITTSTLLTRKFALFLKSKEILVVVLAVCIVSS